MKRLFEFGHGRVKADISNDVHWIPKFKTFWPLCSEISIGSFVLGELHVTPLNIWVMVSGNLLNCLKIRLVRLLEEVLILGWKVECPTPTEASAAAYVAGCQMDVLIRPRQKCSISATQRTAHGQSTIKKFQVPKVSKVVLSAQRGSFVVCWFTELSKTLLLPGPECRAHSKSVEIGSRPPVTLTEKAVKKRNG